MLFSTHSNVAETKIKNIPANNKIKQGINFFCSNNLKATGNKIMPAKK
jgi:hypothetical protein